MDRSADRSSRQRAERDTRHSFPGALLKALREAPIALGGLNVPSFAFGKDCRRWQRGALPARVRGKARREIPRRANLHPEKPPRLFLRIARLLRLMRSKRSSRSFSANPPA